MADPESEAARLTPIAELTLQVARPFLWHDVRESWPKALAGGSCFILRFEDRLIGVTANHVLAALQTAQAQANRVVCLLRTALLDLPAAIIDRHEELDIATFRVTEAQLAESQAVAIDCRQEWPPPAPRPGDAISIGGFPELLKSPEPHDAYPFHGCILMGRVEDVSERQIISVFSPERGDYRVRAAAQLPDVGANFSGCSGGPALLHIERAGLHRWFPAGLVVDGPGADRQGGFDGIDVFHLRRIHFVSAEGSIRAPD